jgi:hypothetical protein
MERLLGSFFVFFFVFSNIHMCVCAFICFDIFTEYGFMYIIDKIYKSVHIYRKCIFTESVQKVNIYSGLRFFAIRVCPVYFFLLLRRFAGEPSSELPLLGGRGRTPAILGEVVRRPVDTRLHCWGLALLLEAPAVGWRGELLGGSVPGVVAVEEEGTDLSSRGGDADTHDLGNLVGLVAHPGFL